LVQEADESTTGPASFIAIDPDGNPIQLYLSAGELEDDQFPYFHQLVAFFEQGNYPGLTLTSAIYAGERHGSEGVALTYLHGLRMLYPQAER